MYPKTLLLAATVTTCWANSEILAQDNVLNELHRVGRSLMRVAGANLEDNASPTLPCNGEGFYRHASDCTKFYRCIDVFSNKEYVRLAFKCKPGTIFSPENKSCISGACSPGLESSPEAAASARVTAGDDDVAVVPSLRHQDIQSSSSSSKYRKLHCSSEGRFADPDDCGQFYDCVPSHNGGFVAHQQSCFGHAFHPTKKVCVPRQMVKGCLSYSSGRGRSFTVTDPKLQQFCNKKENEFLCADCKTLVICVDGKPYSESCEYGSVCSLKKSFSGGVCYPGGPAECTCNKADIFRRDFYNPSKFLSCGIEGTDPIIHSCPNGLVFNEQRRACGTEIESTCTTTGTFAVKDDCTRYYTCILTTTGWVQKEFTCRNNTMYNEETGKCEDPCEWYSGHFTCEAEGRYANPGDCTKYYECIADPLNPAEFSWVEQECPEGYEWSQMVKRGVGHCVASRTTKDKCVPLKPNTCTIPHEWCKAESVSCNSQITRSRSYFINPNFSEPYPHTNPCVVEILPPVNAVQVKLDFESMILSDPVEGNCGNDSFMVIGGNPGSQFPVLCGDNSGQHMYIDIDNSDEALLLTVESDYDQYDITHDRKWKIMVTFLDAESAVPHRCLQYFSETQGIIKSFNYAEDNDYSMALNNLEYSVCFDYLSGYCNINFNFNGTLGDTSWDYGIGEFSYDDNVKELESRCFEYGLDCWNDYVQIGPKKICGDFDHLSITGNSTGPLHLAIKTDDSNESADVGFYASYTMMPCSN